jgi:hypothetical protein
MPPIPLRRTHLRIACAVGAHTPSAIVRLRSKARLVYTVERTIPRSAFAASSVANATRVAERHNWPNRNRRPPPKTAHCADRPSDQSIRPLRKRNPSLAKAS